MAFKRIGLAWLSDLEVRLHPGWLGVAFLVAWSLARGVFPARVPHLPPQTYWWMAAAATAGLFFSVLLHELAHSTIAQLRGAPVDKVMPLVFGGIAALDHEPDRPATELFVAAVGPLA